MLRPSTLALALVLANGLAAQTVVLTPTSTTILPGGGTLTFNATVVYSTPTSVLAFSATLPTNADPALSWTYLSTSSGGPDVTPAPGTTGTLGWAYALTPVPASPATFSFTASYPASLTGSQTLTTTSFTRDTAGSSPVAAQNPPTVKLAVPTNTATWNASTTGNWTTAAAWTPGVVPNNGAPASSTYSATISDSGSAVTVDSQITINDLLFLGGTINGLSANTLTIAGSGSDWQGGAFSGLNQLIIAPDALFTASTFGTHDFVNTTIINQGQFIWRNGGALRSGGTTPGGAFVNAAGATFTDATSGSVPYLIQNGFGGTFTFSNAGTFVKSASSATSIDVPFVNTGNILLNAGTLGFTSTFTQNGGILSLASGTTASFSNGLNFTAGSLTGSGTVSGNVVNGAASGSPAVISPGSILGQLHITGTLGLLTTSQLIFDLGGTTQGVTYDFLSVVGTATLGGTLTLNLVNGAQTIILPTDNFTLLTATSLTGVFSNVLNIAGGTRLFTSDGVSSFLVNYGPSSLTLSNFNAVPEPSTWALLLIGTGALAAGTWRRRARK